MVYGNSRHYTHKCGSAQNSTAGHGKLYAVRKEDGPEICVQGMTPSSLSQNLAPTKTSGDLVWILTSMVIYVVNQRRISSVLDDTDFMLRTQWKTYPERNRKQLVGNNLEVF
jgi:hypothetical protein